MSASDDLSNFSLLDLFRAEVEGQAAAMTAGLLAMERDPGATEHCDEVMRGAHSLKGAARIVNRDSAVRVAHAIEDCIVAAQREGARLPRERIDELLRGVDLLGRIAIVPESDLADWDLKHRAEIDAFLHALAKPVRPVAEQAVAPMGDVKPAQAEFTAREPRSEPPGPPPPERVPTAPAKAEVRALRVTAENVNRLLGLAGESVVAARWLDAFTAELLRFKRLQNELTKTVISVHESLAGLELNERVRGQLSEVRNKAVACREAFALRMDELDSFDRRFVNLSERLYQEVLDCRMRPFADGVQSFPRMVRDLARTLGKEVKLEIVGETTPVDREILERLESPLGHLLRNAVDHGIETPEDRRLAGKPAVGTVRVEARHSAGMLLIELADDGRGIDLEALRAVVVEKGLTTADVAEKLTGAELLEFLFLPGFTMRETVTEISGRGVGLDAVQTMVKEVGGSVRASAQLGAGTQFQIKLPLTLSVVRALLVDIGGEPYAFPLGRIASAVNVAREKIASVEGREHFSLGHEQVGLVAAHQVLGLDGSAPGDGELPVIVLGDKTTRYGLVVDRFLGERELVVRPLDARLGKVKDISAAALMPDQAPALIIDVDDLLRSIENLVSGGRLAHVRRGAATAAEKTRKRVLVVDDSLTVRELERKLIDSQGYEVEVAVDGMDGWNAVRTGHYDLVVTDVDMPRLDGIELVTLIKKDPRLNSLPVMIVSYKDREEDRRRGLEAGADYYLTKGSFHDETLLRAVTDLIGEAIG
jgi:two-component system sensor histidine kinase and response regulator WspE